MTKGLLMFLVGKVRETTTSSQIEYSHKLLTGNKKSFNNHETIHIIKQKVMNKRIYLSPPHMGGQEILYVKNAFDTNWVAPLGPNVDGFEKDISNYLGSGVSTAALNSGTSAIHLALILLGVGRGDEVICQSLTFAASANPILYLGARPVFVDSEPTTWNMSPFFLEQAIKARLAKNIKPKAIVLVHLYGMPAMMGEIMKISEYYEIPIIEDAAEALGSHLNGKKLGTYGAIGILSFNGNKIITTSGGGAMVSKDSELVAKDPLPYFQHSEIGYNYRMSNIAAGIGRGQMEILPLRVYQRRKVFEKYKKCLSFIPGIRFQEEPNVSYYSNRWLTAFTIEESLGFEVEEFRLALEAENIEVRHIWKPMHLQPLFQNCFYFGNGVSEALFHTGICLPSGSNMSELDMGRVLKVLRKQFSNASSYAVKPILIKT
jgi:dTDP-4-amino-4,6-dideoxygalactose transaminase